MSRRRARVGAERIASGGNPRTRSARRIARCRSVVSSRGVAVVLSALSLLVVFGAGAGCVPAAQPKQRIVVHLPEWIWHGREAAPPVAGPSPNTLGTINTEDTPPPAALAEQQVGPYEGGERVFDRRLLGHLGVSVAGGGVPDGCPLGWVPLAYDERYGALGCDAYTAAVDFPSGASTLRVELAIVDGRVLGVIVSNLLPGLAEARSVAADLRAYYSAHAECSAFSEHGFDCDAGRYMVRVVGDRNPTTYHPVVTIYYYADGGAFTGYWNAALDWSRGRREASVAPAMQEVPTVLEPTDESSP